MAMSILYGVLVVGGVCLAAVGGLTLVQFLVPATSRQQHNDVAGFIYAVLGVIYAVLLALVVIAVWEDFGRARETVESEANAAAEIFWLAHRLPEPEGGRLQELTRSYAEEVVEREWPLMREGQAPLMERGQATPNGWIIIDDYVWPWGDGPQRAGDEFLAEHHRKIGCAFVIGTALFVKLSEAI